MIGSITVTKTPKPLWKMTGEERDAFMKKLHKLSREAVCNNCNRPYPKNQGTSGYCPACADKARGTCCG